jgi:hypothetical protein
MVLYTYKYNGLKCWSDQKFPPLIKACVSSTNCTMGSLTCSCHATYLHTIYVKSREIHILSSIQIIGFTTIKWNQFSRTSMSSKYFISLHEIILGNCHKEPFVLYQNSLTIYYNNSVLMVKGKYKTCVSANIGEWNTGVRLGTVIYGSGYLVYKN